MRISDWSSDVCSSDLARVVYAASGTSPEGIDKANRLGELTFQALQDLPPNLSTSHKAFSEDLRTEISNLSYVEDEYRVFGGKSDEGAMIVSQTDAPVDFNKRSAEHTYELQSLMRITYAVFCLKNKNQR